MSKSNLCYYSVEIADGTAGHYDGGAEYSGPRGKGKITESNVFEKVVLPYAKSLEPGGVNEHVSYKRGYIPYPTRVRVRVQKGARAGEVIEWKVPPFFVW